MAKNPETYPLTPGVVYFVGAGPGAPDLITVRGAHIIAQADLVLYADSLVAESVTHLTRQPAANIVGSSGLNLEEMVALMVEAARAGGIVARVHTGDPALYGAINEQMARLEAEGVPSEVVPGVTAAFAAAAYLKAELTIPGVTQTVILTRAAGRTPVPAGEDLPTLAATGATLAIYLSVSQIERVVADLLAGGAYGPETPVAVLHKVTWPDESAVRGTLADIVDKVRAAGYTKHALILVGQALQSERPAATSRLYDKQFAHGYRPAEVPASSAPEKKPAGATAIIAVTRRGSALAARLADELEADLAVPAKQAATLPESVGALYSDSALDEVRRRWPNYERLVLVMPAGVAVRAIAPLLQQKAVDPAVVCLDEAGRSVIPLLGGHQAGANELARQIAALTAGHAAITTASDGQGKPALDLPPSTAQNQPWRIEPASALTYAAGRLVDDDLVGVYLEPELDFLRRPAEAWLARAGNIRWVECLDDLRQKQYAAGLIISHRLLAEAEQPLLEKSVLYRPAVLVVGMGCRRGVPAVELRVALETTLAEAQLALDGVAAVATADLKAEEPGLRELGLPLEVIPAARLREAFPPAQAHLSRSAAQEKFDLPGVAEPCALLAAGPGGRLLVPKRSFARCTVAVALKG
jgi:precorrin-4 C11-methyltransferase